MAVNKVSATNYYTQAALTSPVSLSVALAALKANPKLKNIKILDSTENINRNLATLSAYTNNLTEVVLTTQSTAINVSEVEFKKYGKLLGKISGEYKLSISNAVASSAVTLAANSHIDNFSIKDTSANISSSLNTLKNLENLSKISKITLTTPAIALTLSGDQLDTTNDTTSVIDVIGKLAGNYSMAVSSVKASAAVSFDYVNNQHISSVAVLDDAASITSNLDGLVSLGLRLKEVRGSDSNKFEVSASQMETDKLVIGRLYKGYQLSVLGASLTQASTLTTNKKVVTVTVQDTAKNIADNLALLDKIGASLTFLDVTDPFNSLQVTSFQLGKYSEVLDKITADDYLLSVKQATAAEAQTLLDKDHIADISVIDNDQAISAAIDQLQANEKLTEIQISGKTASLNMSYRQLTDDGGAITKITSNYVLNVKDVPSTIEALSLVTDNARVKTMGVQGTVSELTDCLDDLASLGGRLTSITNSDSGVFALTEERWRGMQPMLDKVTDGYFVTLSEVTAANALVLGNDVRVETLEVKDTAAALSEALNGLDSLGAKLTSIHQNDSSDSSVAVTGAQWINQSTTLDKFGNETTFAVRGANANLITSLAADTRVTSIEIADSSVNIADNLNEIQKAISDLAIAYPARIDPITIRQLGKTNPIQLTAQQLTDDVDAIASIEGAYSLNVMEVLSNSAADVSSNPHVISLTVKDNGEAIVNNLHVLAGLGSKLAGLQQTDLGTNLDMTFGEWTNNSDLIKKFNYGVHANISEVKAAQVKVLLSDSRVDHVAVIDTAANVSAKLNTLHAQGPNLTAITLTDDTNSIRLSMPQLKTLGSTLAKVEGAYKLAVSGANVDDAQKLLAEAYSHVDTIEVTDSSSNIAAALSQLNDNSKLTTITQTGIAKPLSVTVAQILEDVDALTKIMGRYSLAVTNAKTSDVVELTQNKHVASIVVSDDTENVDNNIVVLKAAGAKILSIALNKDASSEMTLTYSEWIANQSVLGKIRSDFSVSVTDVAAANVGIIAASPIVSSLYVSDTTSHIRTNLNSLGSVLTKLQTIEVTDAMTTMNITANQYNNNVTLLSKISDISLNVTGANVDQAQTLQSDEQVMGFTVVDDSESIASHLSELNENSKLTSVKNTTPNIVMSLDSILFNGSSAALNKIDNYQATVSGALVVDAIGLNSNSHVVSFDLSDSSGHINDALIALSNMSDKLTFITAIPGADTSEDAPIELSQSQLNNFAGTETNSSLIETLAKISGDYSLSLTGVTTDNLDLLLAKGSNDLLTLNPGSSKPFVMSLSKITSIAVNDSSQNISAVFDDLIALGSKLDSITLNNNITPIAITPEQFSAGTTLLLKITGQNYHLALIDVLAADAVELSNASKVDTVSIADGADNIATNFDDLQAIDLEGKVLEVEVTDGNDLTLTQTQYDSPLADKVLSSIVLV